MNNNYSYEVSKILKIAEREMMELRHPYVGTEHLLLSLLQIDAISKITSKYDLTYENFRNELVNIVGRSSKKSEVILYTPLLRIVLNDAVLLAKNEKNEVNEFTLMNALLTSDDGIAIRILMLMNIDIDALFNEIAASKGKTLLSIGTNLNEINKDILIGRDEELKSIMEILLRKVKNNPLLIGEAGVGKSAIVYELARRIKTGNVPEKLKKYKIISIDMASLLSNTKYRGEFETRLNNIINEIKQHGNIILFIDEIHTLIKSGGGESSVDAANILKPYLASDDIKIIGATTISEYEHSIARDKALSRRFRTVNVLEPNREETINILRGVRGLYEEYHHVSISDENIQDIVDLTDTYISNNHNPDKSLDVLDYVASRVSLKYFLNAEEAMCNEFLKNKDYKNALKIKKEMRKRRTDVINREDILSVIESICGIKIMNKSTYDDLCTCLDEHIYGQDLTKLKRLLKRKINSNKLLAITINGSDGVGKRYTARTIAENLKYNYLELDMNEYGSSTSLAKIIGSDPGFVGYDDDKLLDKIKYHPYSLIYLDNYQNAHSSIKNLFKSIINKGYTSDNHGERVNFNNSIIVMGTNIKESSIGYLEKSEESDNIIHYSLIDKKCLEGKPEYEKVLNYIKNKTTFQDISKVDEEIVYNS
ncbi:MAG: ATP-dependent Clp protease ATP-binding subunit [Bacilli bacterium]|nr:ATP-dependent Clp protease ATP-binding subunit [Bacilli bacterium]